MNNECPCETCEGKPPQLSENNIKFMRVWNLISNSFFYISTMDNVIPSGLNWTNVESIFRLTRIKPTRLLIRRIRVAEQLTLERARMNAQNEVKKNGKSS